MEFSSPTVSTSGHKRSLGIIIAIIVLLIIAVILVILSGNGSPKTLTPLETKGGLTDEQKIKAMNEISPVETSLSDAQKLKALNEANTTPAPGLTDEQKLKALNNL